jgi:OmpA-OmpF porin, OOP family
MRVLSPKTGALVLVALLTVPALNGVFAQEQPATEQEVQEEEEQAKPQADPIVVQGANIDPSTMTKGPEIKGIISARSGDKIKVTGEDGSSSVIVVTDATRIKNSRGIFSSSKNKLAPGALLNGLPVTVKTMQSGSELVASQISLRNKDFKTATMIRTGTAQQFEEQTAATQALRGRMGDIDKYDIKNTVNVNFDTGKAILSQQAKQELCATATTAEGVDNALMLVVGYTDSTGSEEFNQRLSEKRASAVINYLQQACKWKPYRMLTPTGMAEADPMASNDTVEGKAQNRRVSVNILVSKAVSGL